MTRAGKGTCGGGDGGGGGSGASGGGRGGSDSRDKSDNGGGGGDVVSQFRDDSSVSDTKTSTRKGSPSASAYFKMINDLNECVRVKYQNENDNILRDSAYDIHLTENIHTRTIPSSSEIERLMTSPGVTDDTKHQVSVVLYVESH
nr:protein no-on-transient A-like [Procambarus clarkii]